MLYLPKSLPLSPFWREGQEQAQRNQELESAPHRVAWKVARVVVLPIMNGLREVHAKGILHRDIKPAHFSLADGKRPVLLDFGTARATLSIKSKSLSVILMPYAPLSSATEGKECDAAPLSTGRIL